MSKINMLIGEEGVLYNRTLTGLGFHMDPSLSCPLQYITRSCSSLNQRGNGLFRFTVNFYKNKDLSMMSGLSFQFCDIFQYDTFQSGGGESGLYERCTINA